MGGVTLMINYTLTYSFSGYQAIRPEKPLPGPEIDTQFANASASINSIVNALDQVRRSDGALNNDVVSFDSLSEQVRRQLTGGTDEILVPDINPAAFATPAEAEGGVSNDKLMTPRRTAQALDALRAFASQSEAQAGVSGEAVMSPLRTKEALDTLRAFAGQSLAEAGASDTTVMSPLRTKQQIDAIRTANSISAELTYGAIAANASAVQAVSLPGAEVGDGVVVGLPTTGLVPGLIASAWVSAPGTVTLRLTNITAPPQLSVTFGLAMSSIAAGESETMTVDAPGAVVRNSVTLGLPAAGISSDFVLAAWVSAPDVVSVRLTNITGTPSTPPTVNITARVLGAPPPSITAPTTTFRLTAIRF